MNRFPFATILSRITRSHSKFLHANRGARLIAVVALVLGNFCRADDAPQPPKRMENRFLFVLDTSSAMRSRTNGIDRAVSSLLESDMHGEFRKGDTIGFWTYDEKIHSDLPMLVWSKDSRSSVIEDVMRYLRHQKYEGRAHLGPVLGSIGQIMARSQRLTVIIIHDGSEPIRGTQYDDDINDLQKSYAREFKSSHSPMITVLTSRNGDVVDYSINYPTAITIPHTAFPEPPPETNAPPVKAIVATPPPVINAAPDVPATPPRHIEIIMSGTNRLASESDLIDRKAAAVSAAPVSIVATDQENSQTPTTTPNSAAAQAATQVVANPPPTTPALEKLPEKPEPAPVIAQSSPAPVPASASGSAPAQSPPSVAGSPSQPAETASTLPAPSPNPSLATAPARPAKPVESPAPGVNPPQPEAAPASLAVATAGSQVALFIIAISLLTIAIVLVVFLVRRWRGDGAPSLISQSMDRGR